MQKTNLKTVLFEKAMELFREDGYDNVTIQQICREAGVTRNAFYYYFDSKESLFSSYFENIPDFTRIMLASVLALPSDWEKLWCIYETHLKRIENEGLCICRAFLKVNIDGNGDLLTKYSVNEAVTVPLIKNCQNLKLIRNMTEADKLNYLAMRLIAGILMTWCCKSGDFDLIADSKAAFSALMQPVIQGPQEIRGL